MAEYTTILDDFTVMIRLGIYQHEVEPQPVIVSVRMMIDYPVAPGADAIEEVLDYDFIRTSILKLAADRRFSLQETLCDTIAALCLADARVRRVAVRTVKRDIYPDARIGCEVIRGR